MELLLSEEQRLLRDSAVAFVAEHGGGAAARVERDPTVKSDRWHAGAQQGWLGILVPADQGGLGLGVTELCLLLEEAGKGLVVEPFGAAVAALWAIAQSTDPKLSGALLSEGIAGERMLLPALGNSGAVGGSVAEGADAPQISGDISTVPHAAQADGFVVQAGRATGDELFFVDAADDCLKVTARPTIDGGSQDGVRLTNVAATPVLGVNRNAPEQLVQAVSDRQLLCTSAELLGVAERALDMTTDYLKLREQFGRPIGSFQALQHHAVDAYVDVELTRSLLYQVAAAFDDGRDCTALIAATKSKASTVALTTTQLAIQLHGAIGYSQEHDIGLYLKRAMTLSSAFGNAAAQRRRFRELVDQ